MHRMAVLAVDEQWAREREALQVAKTAVCVQGDAEGVHQARVSIRRLRSSLQIVKPLLDGTSLELPARLQEMAARFGLVRDLDVLQARLAELKAGPALLEGAALERKRAFQSLLNENSAAFELPTGPHLLRDVPLLLMASDVLRRRSRAWSVAIRDAQRSKSYHGARIQAKKLRYALDWFAPEFPEIPAAVRLLAKLQDTLGEWQDLSVLQDWLATHPVEEGLENRIRGRQKALRRRAKRQAERLHPPLKEVLKSAESRLCQYWRESEGSAD